jgi:hypothetical protein
MRRKAALVALGIWLAIGIIAGGLLLLRHAAYRVPEADDAHLQALTSKLAPNKFGVAHIMYRSCACSSRTITHLLERGALPSIDELVVIVDDDGTSAPDDQLLVAAGFRVQTITPLILKERFGIHAAPVLVVARPDHSVAYIGGYNRHKQEPRYADVAIVDDVIHTTETSALPVFGCATSAALER